jgi:3',5'-cyclic AMP phosphodiesterase CpdA
MGLLGGSILGWPRIGTAEPKDQAVAPLKRAVRLAHITDVHVQPELGATEGFVKCLHHIQAQSDAPGLILNTGDCIMDSMHRKEPRTKLQWDIWNRVLSEECSTPIEHAIGNHDCWGIDKLKSGTTGGEPLWGKQWALDALGLTKRYRSFDRNGWHFIVLDSVEPYQNGYKAKLDEEQMAWLKSDLEAVSKEVPILVMSHIPIVSPGGILNGTRENPERDLVIPGGTMHLDSKEIHALLSSKGNVKICLSGHLHILDRAEYDGITYISSGAVSSGWWKKVHMGRFDYGYALVDLFTNGTFQFSYVPFGWRTKQSQT